MAERRRQEIEEKKAKLAELRRARDERKALLAQAEAAGPSASVQQPLTNRKDVNDLVESLLQRPASPYASSSRGAGTPLPRAPSALGQSVTRQGTPPPSSHAGVGSSFPATPSGRQSRLSEASLGQSTSTNVDRGVDTHHPAQDEGHGAVSVSSGMQDASTSTQAVPIVRQATPPPPPAPKPAIVTYSKGVQTSDMAVGPDAADRSVNEGADEDRQGSSGRETEDEMRKRILEEIERERQALEAELKEMKEKEHKVAELSADQRQAIFATPDFSSFIEESSRIVQRALSDGYDYIKDYTIGLDGAFDTQRVKLACAFSDERWTAGRSVTDLDWSAKYPELVAASYNKNPSSLNDPDGIVAIWNLHLLERPEFVFHAPSDVLSVTFSPYHPNLVFGGSYAGQILLWDTRAKHLPVLKTPLSAAGHTYPIYAMKMVGTQNANSLISSSTDGLVCSWLADMLAQPQVSFRVFKSTREALPLTVSNQSKTDEVSITSLDFSPSDTASFFIGTEEGSIHHVDRYDQPSRKAGISSNPEDAYRAHAGPITGLHFHPSTGSLDFGDLFLSSSVDWSVKLWRAKGTKAAPAGALATNGTSASTSAGRDKRDREKEREKDAFGQIPLHSFESADDYVFDVKWHPHHPAIFGSVDGGGKFDLWNLNQDTEVPIISTQVSPRALNKLAFDKTPQARKAALGGADGKVYVYDLAEKLVTPRDAEWTDMQRVLQGMGHRDTVLGGVQNGGERDRDRYAERGYR